MWAGGMGAGAGAGEITMAEIEANLKGSMTTLATLLSFFVKLE